MQTTPMKAARSSWLTITMHLCVPSRRILHQRAVVGCAVATTGATGRPWRMGTSVSGLRKTRGWTTLWSREASWHPAVCAALKYESKFHAVSFADAVLQCARSQTRPSTRVQPRTAHTESFVSSGHVSIQTDWEWEWAVQSRSFYNQKKYLERLAQNESSLIIKWV